MDAHESWMGTSVVFGQSRPQVETGLQAGYQSARPKFLYFIDSFYPE